MTLLLALLLGAASAFAFQPVGLWPLMPLSFAALAHLVDRQPRLRGAVGIGWAYGLGQFCVGLNWIATAFTFQSAMPAWLGWVAVVLLSLYLAVYPAISTGLAWRFGRHRPIALVLALGGSWALTEWLRGTMFTGFPWNPVGVTLVDTLWRQASSLVGTYGLSALVVLAGGMLWLATKRQWKAPAAFAAVAIVLGILPHETPPASHGPAARVVQPNIGQQDKWREGFDSVAADRLNQLSRPAAGEAPSMLFWPEAAVTNPLVDERAAAVPFVAYERLRAVEELRGDQLLATGGIALTSGDHAHVDGATNSVFVLDSRGHLVGRYDKAHLVPYGEYLPMRPILSALGLSRLAPGDLDFRPGPGARTLALPNGMMMGVQICYEIIFSGRVVDPRHRPDYIFNPSNDAWFGAWGPPQHLAQARLRAAEEALPIVRATPTGISAMVDSTGALVDAIGPGKAQAIQHPLPRPGAATAFSRLGNILPLLLGAILLVVAIALGRRDR